MKIFWFFSFFYQILYCCWQFRVSICWNPNKDCLILINLVLIYLYLFLFVGMSIPCSESESVISFCRFDFMFNLLTLENYNSAHVRNHINNLIFQIQPQFSEWSFWRKFLYTRVQISYHSQFP